MVAWFVTVLFKESLSVQKNVCFTFLIRKKKPNEQDPSNPPHIYSTTTQCSCCPMEFSCYMFALRIHQNIGRHLLVILEHHKQKARMLLTSFTYMKHIPIWYHNLPQEKSVKGHRGNVQCLECRFLWHEVL